MMLLPERKGRIKNNERKQRIYYEVMIKRKKTKKNLHQKKFVQRKQPEKNYILIFGGILLAISSIGFLIFVLSDKLLKIS